MINTNYDIILLLDWFGLDWIGLKLVENNNKNLYRYIDYYNLNTLK